MKFEVKNDEEDEEVTPLRLNFAVLVAKERRQAIIQFAEKKFAVSQTSQTEVGPSCTPIDIFKAMLKVEADSQNFYSHLTPGQGERLNAKLLSMTAQDLQTHLPSVSETKIASLLTQLSLDASELVAKVSFDQGL